MKIRKILSVILTAILLVLCTACSSEGSLDGKYINMSSLDDYNFVFENDGTVIYSQGGTFFNGTYKYFDGKYEIYIQGEGPFLSTKFIGEKIGDTLIISGGIFAEREFKKYIGSPESNSDSNPALTAKEAPASDFQIFESDNGDISIYWYVGMNEALRIPAEIDGKKVVKIGAIGTPSKGNIKYVAIPDGVTELFRTFDGCDKIKTVTIPTSVTKIGLEAFSDCAGLTSITIPRSVTIIGDKAFENCTGLSNVYIPSSVTEIGYNAFSGCTAKITYKGKTYTRDNYEDLYKAINGN